MKFRRKGAKTQRDENKKFNGLLKNQTGPFKNPSFRQAFFNKLQ